MNVNELPLVSCIMPTYNRRKFVPFAIEYFRRQNYGNKELIVVDDGTDIIDDLIPRDPRIRYYRLNKKITLGAKLNLACNYAQGEIIANWDDDDWYASTRLTYQVDALKINNNIEVCGINNLLYYDLQNNSGYRYIYPAGQKPWLLGSSLCYTKKLWYRNRFADINVGMDGLFVWATSPGNIKVLSDSTMSVHMIHESNVSPKKTNNNWWHTYPVDELKKIMKNDWNFYNNENVPLNIKITSNHTAKFSANDKTKPLKNIYACLVHDSEECIIDLVRNLHYHDPSSTILLYNGGTDERLFSRNFPFEKFGAIIHPQPVPVQHGYLHPFALNCMQFALDNFLFDVFTIVDSDQLAIRSGYAEYLGDFFSTRSDVGLLSSNPERVSKNNTVNRVAIQAFKEYDLWKPLLNRFQDGENNFAYWTFWPSTVFTKDAVKDLVKFFKENKQLQDIMNRTRIWASEEVILPTLVKLLGYKIAANPCSYDFVQYQKKFTIQEVGYALNKENAYWLHPVERLYDAPLRKYIRQFFCNYSEKNKDYYTNENSSLEEFKSSLINKLKNIEGWLSDAEATLLITITGKVCNNLPSLQNIVEIGSYHGKSTVLFGSILKRCFAEVKLFAIDPHDGRLGAEDQHIQLFPPSFEKLKKNIADAGLYTHVEIIKGNSYNVIWENPISLLFIDGLHDYLNVSGDFKHFSSWIMQNGYVVFHDYAPYFPGVKRFVDELLRTKNYLKVQQVESTIVLQKL